MEIESEEEELLSGQEDNEPRIRTMSGEIDREKLYKYCDYCEIEVRTTRTPVKRHPIKY